MKGLLCELQLQFLEILYAMHAILQTGKYYWDPAVLKYDKETPASAIYSLQHGNGFSAEPNIRKDFIPDFLCTVNSRSL